MESLKPQDVLVVLKLCSVASKRAGSASRPSMALLGTELGLSPSEVHAAIRRAQASGLLQKRSDRPGLKRLSGERPNTTAIAEFLVHGLKYVFPASNGELTRGVPTSYAAPPLNARITKGSDPIPVWPYAEGEARGSSFEPLYRTVPYAALRDPVLYELLALTDAFRSGRARERKIAEEQLRARLRKVHVE